MTTVAVLNQKGGVGKTTTTVNLGAGLAALGRRVMLIDLDAQANLTLSLGMVDGMDTRPTMLKVLQGEATVEEVAIEREGMTVVPSSVTLAGADYLFASAIGRDTLLADALAAVKGYDYLLLDCPPSLGFMTINALAAADEALVPVQVEYLALHGIASMTKTIEAVRKRLNRSLSLGYVVCTRYDERRTLNREVVDNIRGHFGDRLLKTIIRENIAVAEAPSHGKPIQDYKPSSHGTEDYTALAAEFDSKHKGGKV